MYYNKLISLCDQLSSFVVGTEGNVSQRTDSGFTIKSSGTSITDERFVRCDIDGTPLSKQKDTPSMEVSFHSWIYRNSNYKFIAHTHPTNTLKILCSRLIYEFSSKRLFPDQVVFNGATSCVIPYATPGNDLTEKIKIAIDIRESCPNLFLLRNHGIICCANSIKEAVVMTAICEKAAEIYVGLKSTGGEPCFLSREEIRAIQNHDDEIYRKNI